MTALRSETDEEIEAQIRDGAYKSKQASLFQQQLDLAVELGLNVVIHQRDAWRTRWKSCALTRARCAVFFIASAVLSIRRMKFSISTTSFRSRNCHFQNGVAVRKVAAEIPLWKFMVETDCPYLARFRFAESAANRAYVHRS